MKRSEKSYKKSIKILAVSVAVLFIVISFAVFARNTLPNKRVLKAVNDNAERFNVDKCLILAVIKCESGFNENALSDAGAVGLMQLLPSTAKFIAEQINLDDFNLSCAEDNVTLGVVYIAYLFERYTELKTVIAAYNAGEGRVSAWLKNIEYSNDGKILSKIPFAETEGYVNRVCKYIKFYKTFY